MSKDNNPLCPRCENHLAKNGIENGKQTFVCKPCRASDKLLRLNHPNCRICGDKLGIDGFKSLSDERFFCRTCWNLKNRVQRLKDKGNRICPHCDLPMKKNGHSGARYGKRQRWTCYGCHKSLTENPRKGGKPRIFPDRILTHAECQARHQRKKILAAIREKFGGDEYKNPEKG